jgi:phosphate uptake regulator
MVREYKVTRKLQEQSGSYFVTLPKIWVKSWELKEGDMMSVIFNNFVKIEPPIKSVQDTRSENLKEVKTYE